MVVEWPFQENGAVTERSHAALVKVGFCHLNFEMTVLNLKSCIA